MFKKIVLAFLFLPVLLLGQVKNAETSQNVTQYFYDDQTISIQIWYSADNKPDSTKTYYPNGKLNEVFYYDENGLKNADCFQFNKQGEKLVTWNFSHGKLVSRTDHKLPFGKDSEEKVKKALQLLTEINLKTNYNPTRINDLYNRGVLMISLGNTTLALEDLKKVEYSLDKDPKNKDLVLSDTLEKKKVALRSLLYERLASIYGSLDMESFAYQYYFKAIKNGPNDLHILDNFAELLQRGKTNDLARFYLEKILSQKSDHTQAKLALATLNKVENTEAKEPSVSPNPAQTFISIENLKTKNFDFEFFNFESKSVLKGKTTDGTINIIALNPGFYILKVNADNVAEIFKVIKE
jgi:tetratricopeptide (TPR) repeat protein